MSKHPFEYLFSGALSLISISFLLIVINNYNPSDISGLLLEFSKIGFIAQAIGTLIILTLAYPFGYISNILSYLLLDWLWRNKYYSVINNHLPDQLKEELISIYDFNVNGIKYTLPVEMQFTGPEKYLNLLRVRLVGLDSHSYQKGMEVWTIQCRYFRVFFISFMLASLSLILCFIVFFSGNGSLTSWLSIKNCIIILISFISITIINYYLYKRALNMETRSFITRYLTARNRIKNKAT